MKLLCVDYTSKWAHMCGGVCVYTLDRSLYYYKKMQELDIKKGL